jgi:arabinofuranosyltransferase
MIFIFVMSHHFIDHVSDDGAIFMRYAQNMIAGKGLVFNEGEYVEGYSSPLWLILMYLCSTFLSVPAVPQFLGILLVWSSFGLLYTALEHRQSFWIQQLIFAVALLFGGHFYWMSTGMETPLLCFLWMGTAVFWGKKRGLVFLSLLGITRPEGLFLVLLGVFFWKKELSWSERFSNWKDRNLFALLPAASWFLFRFIYYGDLLPNTYYAKTGGDLTIQLNNGFQYTYQFFIPMLVLGIVVVYNRIQKIAPIYFLILADVFVIAFGGGDWMLWGRMLVPLWLCWWVCFPRINLKEPKHLMLFGVSIWGIWPLLLSSKAIQVAFEGRRLPIAGYQEGSLVDMSREQAVYIRELAQEHFSNKKYTIAVNHAGFLPYFLSEHNFLDMTGLNNKYIAHHSKGGLHHKYDVDYVLDQSPDIIIFHSPQIPTTKKPFVQGIYWSGEMELLQDQRFWNQYQFQKNYWQRQGQGATILYSLLAVRKTNLEEE